MWFKVLVFYMCFASVKIVSIRLDNFLNDINSSVSVQPSSNKSNYVTFKNIKSEVYSNNLGSSEEYAREDKTALFYLSINCQLSNWTINKLYDIIETNTSFYHPQFKSRHGNLSADKLKASVEQYKNLVDNIVRFINVLFTFNKLYTYSALLDTSFLKNLLTLSFDIDYMQTLLEDCEHGIENRINLEKLHDFIFDTTLQIVNSIQQFMSLNCKLSKNVGNVQFFGLMMSRTKTLTNMRVYLLYMKSLQLETAQYRCSVNKMLLVEALTTYDEFYKDISVLELHLKCNITTVKNIFEQVKLIHEPEVVFWYQSVIFNAIVKLIIYKTKPFLKINRIINDDITKGFKIVEPFFSDFTNLPEDLIGCFKLLAKKQEFTPKELQYMNTAIDFYLQRNRKEYVDGPTSKFLPFEIVMPKDVRDSNLEVFMNAIVNQIFHFKCFFDLFEFLNNEYRLHHFMVHTKNPVHVSRFVNKYLCSSSKLAEVSEDSKPLYTRSSSLLNIPEFDHNDRIRRSKSLGSNKNIGASEPEDAGVVTPDVLIQMGCDLFINLYRYCFETSILVNSARTPYLKVNLDFDLRNIESNILTLTYFLTGLTSWYRQRLVSRISFNLVPSIAVAYWLSELNHRYEDRLQLLYLSMSEFNVYGTQFCKPPRYGTNIFTRMDFYEIGSHHSEIRSQYDLFMNAAKQKRTTKLTLPSITDLCDLYDSSSVQRLRYKDIVTLSWRGTKRDIDSIFKEIGTFVSNPFYVYALYDVFLKFCLALIYYETVHFANKVESYYAKSDDWNVKNIFEENKIHIDHNDFPLFYEKYILNFNKTMQSFTSEVVNYAFDQQFTPSIDVLKKLYTELKSFGVFVDTHIANRLSIRRKTEDEILAVYAKYLTDIRKINNLAGAINAKFNIILNYFDFRHDDSDPVLVNLL